MEIDEVKAGVWDSDLLTTEHFFKKWCPTPSDKNFQTQTGVHFEEITEMLETFKGTDRITQSMLTAAYVALHGLALHLKNSNFCIEILDREGFLDSLGDQIVTATGTGYMAGMDVPNAFGEINRSNTSKFDENGEPILDQNLKMMKGPHYFKPNLKPYI